MAAQGRMLQFKYLFPWVYACWIWLNRCGLRLQWLLVKPIRVRIGDIWTFSAVAGACGVILAILLFVFRGTTADAQQPLNLSSESDQTGENSAAPEVDEFIPAALAAYQPAAPVESSVPVQSSIPTQPMPTTSIPRITIRQNANLQATLHRTLLPVGWDQRETMELVSIPNPQVELRLFDPREPWRLASMLPTSDTPPFASYVDQVGRLDAAEFGPSLVTPSEVIYAFDPVDARENPLISVTKQVPEHVRRGERFAYEIVIENQTTQPLESVLVREHVSALDRVEAVQPEAKVVGDYLWWELMLQPREIRRIQVEIRPNDVGSVSSNVDVTVVSRIGASTRVSEAPEIASPDPLPSMPDVEPSVAQQPAPVVDPFPETQPLPPRTSIPTPPTYQPQPNVSMTVEPNTTATAGSEWSTVFTVTNSGDASAYDVAIEIDLPRHLRHQHGTSIRHHIAELAPGETRTARLIAIAEITGTPQFDADLSVGNVVIDQQTIGLSITSSGDVEPTSYQQPTAPSTRPCSTAVFLVRPGCAW